MEAHWRPFRSTWPHWEVAAPGCALERASGDTLPGQGTAPRRRIMSLGYLVPGPGRQAQSATERPMPDRGIGPSISIISSISGFQPIQ